MTPTPHDTRPHPCPGGCGRTSIAHHSLACRYCWARLPAEYRQLINATYQCRNLFPRDHHQAVTDAIRWYADNPAHPGRPA